MIWTTVGIATARRIATIGITTAIAAATAVVILAPRHTRAAHRRQWIPDIRLSRLHHPRPVIVKSSLRERPHAIATLTSEMRRTRSEVVLIFVPPSPLPAPCGASSAHRTSSAAARPVIQRQIHRAPMSRMRLSLQLRNLRPFLTPVGRLLGDFSVNTIASSLPPSECGTASLRQPFDPQRLGKSKPRGSRYSPSCAWHNQDRPDVQRGLT